MMINQTSDDVIDRLKTAQQKPLGDPRFRGLLGLEKSTFTEASSATSGLTFYDLDIGAKFLYPVLTPLREYDPARLGQGRHSSGLACDYCD